MLPVPSSAAEGTTAEDPIKKVLVLHSFARDYFDVIADALQAELALSAGPVELYEVSFETARFGNESGERPFLDYLHALLDETQLDVVIAIAGPASRFSLRHHDTLFPSVPLVLAGIDPRLIEGMTSAGDVTSVTIDIDFTVAVENVLDVAPDTDEIAVVLGRSAISKVWLAEIQQELAPLTDRVRFVWLHDLAFPELIERVASLPPRSAVIFGEYAAAAGLLREEDDALGSICRSSSVPVFGLFESQLGSGVVGGRLLSQAEVGRRAGTIARSILQGEAADSAALSPIVAGNPVYDFRELARWNIGEKSLPSGSRVLFRPVSVWDEYRGPLLIGLGVIGFQTALIAGLLVQHARRRVAEEQAHALARRLLTAQEDERRRLARDLHDDLSQRMATLGLDAARMERSLSDSHQKEAARAMRSDLARMSEDVHALSYRLHPTILEELGLKNALEVECDRFSRRETIRAELTSFEAPSVLPQEVSVCLFRIAQEALRNVARHAGAKAVDVMVIRKNATLSMVVRDDGAGFDPAKSRARMGLGLASMRERAALVNGKVKIESTPSRGTTLEISVPLTEVPS